MRYTNNMRYVFDNLKARHFDVKLHTAWVDEEEGVATFPLWNLSGCLVGYQQYRPRADKKKDNHPKMSRYFTYRKNKVIGLWGLESWNLSNVLFVTEGVFDACRLTARGYSAVATLANDLDPPMKEWFYMVRSQRPVVVVCDGDKAGRKLAKAGHIAHVMSEGMDLGEAPDTYVGEMLKSWKLMKREQN